MKIKLDKSEIDNLLNEKIQIIASKDYSEDESLDILDEVHDIETMYSSFNDEKSEEYIKAEYFAKIADKIQEQIDNEWGF